MRLTYTQEDRVVDLLRRGNAVVVDKYVYIAPKGKMARRLEDRRTATER